MTKKISSSPSLLALLSLPHVHYTNTGTAWIITGCMGVSAPLPEAPPSPPFSLTVDSSGHFPHIVSLCHSCCCSVFLDHRGTTNITNGLSFSQRHGHLGLGWNWLPPPQGQILASSHTRQFCSPLATKTFPSKPNALPPVIQLIIQGSCLGYTCHFEKAPLAISFGMFLAVLDGTGQVDS